MDTVVCLDGRILEDVWDIKLIEGMDQIAEASFITPMREIGGSEEVVIEVDTGDGFRRRFLGNIRSFVETEYDEIEITAESKVSLLRDERVPYSEIEYKNKSGDWIVKQLLHDYGDWCDTSALTELDTIPHVHFVEESILDALNMVAKLCDKWWFWDPETKKIHYVNEGSVTSGTTIDADHSSEVKWSVDQTSVRNYICVRGGHVDGDSSKPLITKIAWDGESAQLYGRKEHTHIDPEITNEDSAQELADALLALHKDPAVSFEILGLPYDRRLKVGTTVPVSQTAHDGTYVIRRIETDLEHGTMDLRLSKVLQTLAHEIRDMQKDLAIVKRSSAETYEGGNPILVRKEWMRRDSMAEMSPKYSNPMTLPIRIPGTMGGGWTLDRDTMGRPVPPLEPMTLPITLPGRIGKE